MGSNEPLVLTHFDRKRSGEENLETNTIRKYAEYRSDLQGIRALAIVAVLLFHFYPERFPNGYLGVDQFFVLSGFLMSMMLEREKRLRFRAIVNFYYRRVRRILPSYLLVILFSLIASHFIFLSSLQAMNWESAIYALTFTINIKAADSVREYTRMISKASDLFTHTWSIALEMQFYFIFPVIFIIYKRIHKMMAKPFLVAVGLTSLLLHVCLQEPLAFNMVHARLWQFIFGVLVQQSDQKPTDEKSTKKCINPNVHRIYFLMVVAIDFLPFPLFSRSINRIVCTFLTAGLIHFHPVDGHSILSSRCFTYVGKLSYSLYLVHWPIYTITKTQFPNNSMSLHFGLMMAVLASVVLTETFEKAYLQANIRTIFYLIVCLYVITALFKMNEISSKPNRNDTQWITELFTPVCTVKKFQSADVCDIPFNRMKFSTEEIIQINEFVSLNDLKLLLYAKCSYRRNSGPFGWCDIPSENRTVTRRILVIGNSYAANQGPIVHQSCAGSAIDMKIYSELVCEVLMMSTYTLCHNSRKKFHDAVLEYKPDVLFILTRHIDLMEMSMTASNETAKMMVANAVEILRDLSQFVTDRIFVLNAIPRPTRPYLVDLNAAIRAGKVLDQNSILYKPEKLFRTRAIVEQAVASCTKCTVIDYTHVFTANGTFESYDVQTKLVYINEVYHLSPLGLYRLQPFYKQICENINSKPVLL